VQRIKCSTQRAASASAQCKELNLSHPNRIDIDSGMILAIASFAEIEAKEILML
jgi:hypothetical protein